VRGSKRPLLVKIGRRRKRIQSASLHWGFQRAEPTQKHPAQGREILSRMIKKGERPDLEKEEGGGVNVLQRDSGLNYRERQGFGIEFDGVRRG